MRLLLPVLAAVAALSFPLANAKVASFPADNFSIDAPANWDPLPLPPAQQGIRVITSARSKTNGDQYLVIGAELPSHSSPSAFLAGMQKPLIAKGWKASEIRDETIDGKPFAVFTMSRETGPPFMLMATTFADERAFVVQVVAPEGDVEKTPELNAIVQSFRFLQPVHSVNRHDAVGDNLSYQIGRIVGFLIGGAAVLILIRKATRSRR